MQGEDEDDADFDDQSLLRWRRQKIRMQKIVHASSGKTETTVGVASEPEKTGRNCRTVYKSPCVETSVSLTVREIEVLGTDVVSFSKQVSEYGSADKLWSINSSSGIPTPIEAHHPQMSPSPSIALSVSDTSINLTLHSPTPTATSTSLVNEQPTCSRSLNYPHPSPSPHHLPPTLLHFSPKNVKTSLIGGGRKRQRNDSRSSSKMLRGERQTSLLQFATGVHRSVSNSIKAHRLSRSPFSGPYCVTTEHSESVACGSATYLPAAVVGTSRAAEAPGRGGRQGGGAQGINKRQCPFYKRVPETGMVVDAFSYGSIPGCPAYFLSHFHSDHYMGLGRRFQHPIYCSQVTANLVQQILKVSATLLHPLPLDTACHVEGVEVMLIEANHCPGSVMFLFKTASGRNYLHTGDFRFCPIMTSLPCLHSHIIHQLFLDTTYCNPQYSFPTQQEVIEFAIRKSQEAIRRHPGTVVVSGTYTIGKERVFLALAEALGSKICVTKEKEAILGYLQWPELQSLLTTAPLTASVHVLPMRKLNVNDLSEYLGSLHPVFSRVLAFSPTGWSHSGTRANLSTLRPKTGCSVTVYGIPYSEHSSFDELKQFVQFLQPQRVIPTVGNQSAATRKEMMSYLEQWRKGPVPTAPKTRQTSIDHVVVQS